MNKKIVSLVVLLILLVSMAATYIVLNQPSTEEEISFSDSDIPDDDISNEVSGSFLDEDDEVDIGDIF